MVVGERGAEKARYEVRHQRGLPSMKASRYNARQKGNVLIKGGCYEESVEREDEFEVARYGVARLFVEGL